MRAREAFGLFWKHCPALHVGLSLLVGAAIPLACSWGLLLPAPLLMHTKKKVGQTLLFVFLGALYTFWMIPSGPTGDEPVLGRGAFHIENVKVQPSPFHKSYLYKGKITHFTSKEGICFYNLPCTLTLPYKKGNPPANIDYLIEGTLHAKENHSYHLKPKKNIQWKPISETWSFAEARLQAKEKVRAFLKTKIPHPKSSAFLTALATGEIDERTLMLEFGRLGIQHILAISGFHFALIAGFLTIFLRLFLPIRYAAALLLLLLTLYFGFIGNAPSVTRAWIGISLYLAAQIGGLRTSGLNALGVALIGEIVYNPLLILHLGFQLSFLATIAILILYPLLNHALTYLLPKRPLDNLIMMSSLEQHIYLLGAFLRQALSINLAVHLATVPLLLFLFHKFPLLSVAYNLFIPVGVTAILLLLCTSLLAGVIPPLGDLLHQLNSYLLKLLLQITEHPPALFDYTLRLPPFPVATLFLFFALLFYGALLIQLPTEESLAKKPLTR